MSVLRPGPFVKYSDNCHCHDPSEWMVINDDNDMAIS